MKPSVLNGHLHTPSMVRTSAVIEEKPCSYQLGCESSQLREDAITCFLQITTGSATKRRATMPVSNQATVFGLWPVTQPCRVCTGLGRCRASKEGHASFFTCTCNADSLCWPRNLQLDNNTKGFHLVSEEIRIYTHSFWVERDSFCEDRCNR